MNRCFRNVHARDTLSGRIVRGLTIFVFRECLKNTMKAISKRSTAVIQVENSVFNSLVIGKRKCLLSDYLGVFREA